MTQSAQSTTLFQRNKHIYIQEEDKLKDILSDEAFHEKVISWLESTITELDLQFEICDQKLAELQQNISVESGNYWCSKTVIKHCNLHLDVKNISSSGADTEQHATIPEVVHAVSSLQLLKTQPFITPKQKRFIEQCEAELSSVVFEPRELGFISNALRVKLREGSNARSLLGSLAEFQNTIEVLSPDVDKCEQLLEASISNGEMALAEEISERQLKIYERILQLITDQYPIITNHYVESRVNDRRQRWAIFRMADKDITAVIEGKNRQIEACEEDLLKIKEQIENYNNDDTHQRKRYETDRGLSDEFLQKNREQQQGVWNRMFELAREMQQCQVELSKLAQKRRKEIERRLQMEEREAGRRSGHESFLKAVSEHAQKLQNIVTNAIKAKDLATSLNNFVLDGCDTIASKVDKRQNTFSEMLRAIQSHHFKRYSDYYLAASRYLYRKERRLMQLDEEIRDNEIKKELHTESLDVNAKKYVEANKILLLKRRELGHQIVAIRANLDKASEDIEPTLSSLRFAGVEYVHPSEIAKKVNLNRHSTILDYREKVTPSTTFDEKVKVEEEKTLLQIRAAIEQENSERASYRRTQLPMLEAKYRTPLQRQVGALLDRRLNDTPSAGSPSASYPKAVTHPLPGHQKVPGTHGAGGEEPDRAAATLSAKPSHLVSSRRNSLEEMGDGVGGDASTASHGVQLGINDVLRVEGRSLRALYPYKARAPDELTFDEGEVIVCVSRAQEEGWLKGVCNQRTGLFPINYVAPCDEDD
ncbi:paraflagellar rod protein, putative [Trypanosoma brucei brucei TREU927]|uniref:Paraflagellar rod protein, putative n=1 Tax=Trypanosoma brucei brucei (strain 927/4 GUTat10.1) TaxID=185431 RepID=Q586U8_TRYB2|nr:paraflagellar rod protein, putative [Trypanosoma brucei brucei TREU927]AAQ15890.1 paraflagellar rod protein, putative [Trypanosoma brucei brucei TREU927]AAX79643.1 paraflagellar rod protein, putative [Trypanosoma brucei]